MLNNSPDRQLDQQALLQSFETSRALCSESIRAVVDTITFPLIQESIAEKQGTSLSPDRLWSLDSHTDEITGWTNFHLRNIASGKNLLKIPASRNATAVWLKDSSGVIFTAFPNARPGTDDPFGPERLMIVDVTNQRLDEVPLNYPPTSRLALLVNDQIDQALISLREGNHKFHTLFSLPLESINRLTFSPVDCGRGFFPLQAWRTGFIGISDGLHGRGQLEFVAARMCPKVISAEKEEILLTALAADDAFFLVRYFEGQHQLTRLAFDLSAQETPIYRGETVLENLHLGAENHPMVRISRLDMAPLNVPCQESAFKLVGRELCQTGVRHQHREFPSRDGETIPVEIYHPAFERSDRLLICTYGAWGVPLDARFDALRSAWLELGGSMALIGVRGGGEKGALWHIAGQGQAKQVSVCDLIDTLTGFRHDPQLGHYQLVGYGNSAGATVIASALAQMPDLLTHAVLESGVYDMERYAEFGPGAGWKNEFGDTQEDPRAFREFSPLSLKSSLTTYPSLMLVTGEFDATVSPAHTAIFNRELVGKWGADCTVLEAARLTGHNFNTSLQHSEESQIRQAAVDRISKELSFLLS